MTSQPAAALGIAPIPGVSALMNYASMTTSGGCMSYGTAGLNSQPFSNAYNNSNRTPRLINLSLFRNFGGISYRSVSTPGHFKGSFLSRATFLNMANEPNKTVVPPTSSDTAPSQTSTITPAPHSQPPSQPHLYIFSHSAPPFFALPPLRIMKICDPTLLPDLRYCLVAETGAYIIERPRAGKCLPSPIPHQTSV